MVLSSVGADGCPTTDAVDPSTAPLDPTTGDQMSGYRHTALSRTAHRLAIRTLSMLAGVATVAGLGVVVAAPAHADEPFPVTSSGLTLTGHGWGHGLGMSQWGAQGAALLGIGYRQILSTYYPGTTVGAAAGTIAVRIDAAGTSQVAVAASSGLTATDLGDNASWTLPSGPSRWRVVLAGSGAGWLESWDGSTWSRWTPPDGRAYLRGILRFQNGPVTIVLSDGSLRHVRGVVDAIGTGGSALVTVNTVSLDDYVRGVVGAEVSPSWKPEAIKAQAVAARTFGVSRRDTATGAYQICSTDACQVYRGIDAEYASVSAAVDGTAGEVLLYNGRAATAMFASSNGGYSVAGSVPYLVAKADPWDEASGQNPVHTWTTTLSQAALSSAFGVGTVTGVRVLARDGNGEWGGRVTSVAVDGTAGSTTVSGATFTSRMGLRMSWWTGPAPQTAILQRWSQMGGNGSLLGPVASAEYAVPNGAAQDFAHGRMYWSRWTGARWAWGALLGYYDAQGGPGGWLRYPVSDERSVSGGAAQDFERGSVYWSSGYGPQPVLGGIKVAYDRWGGPNGLGLPTAGERGVAGGAEQTFTRGRVLFSSATSGHPLWGAIEQAWLARGGLGAAGFPTTDEAADAGSVHQSFQVGEAVWSSPTGAHFVWGAIGQTWHQVGAGPGPLGLPTGEEQAVSTGTAQVFQHGAVGWDPQRGTTVAWGAIGERYLKEGGPSGSLGLPLGNEQGTATGSTQTFEHGSIVWTAATNGTEVRP
jgi:stage II sporulation protein D